MTGQSLTEKIETSYRCFEQLLQECDPAAIRVAWTGGKDSTVVLALWKKYLIRQGFQDPVPLFGLNLDTGLKFPEVMAFRDEWSEKWKVGLAVVRPEAQARSLGPDPGDPVSCCRRFKIQPLHRAVQELQVSALLTGIRADEHPSRQGIARRELRQEPGYLQLHPILHWTEMDIWAFHQSEALPYCPLYDQGYRSLGCMPCTERSRTAERSGRQQDKESRLDLLRSLGYF